MAYLSASELRARVPALAKDTDTFDDEVLEELVAEFEELAERYRGVAYEPREVTESFDLCRAYVAVLGHVKVTAVSALTVDDTAVTDYTFLTGYSVKFEACQTGTLEITYTHGHTSPPTTVLRACREYVRSCALTDRSGVPRDAVVTSADGFTIRYSTPDWEKGRPTGFLEVDRLLNTLEDHRLMGVA